MYNIAGDVQRVADAAALSGASAIVEDEWSLAHGRAASFISRNPVMNGFLPLDGQIIELGKWHWSTQTFTLLEGSDQHQADAVRVVGTRHDAPLFFAGIMGRTKTTVARDAVAQSSPPCGGIWGLEGIDVPGGIIVDSYDSTSGPYSAVTAGEEGDLCSGRHIDAMGSFEVHGDAIAGLGYDVTQHGGSGTVTGTMSSRSIPPKISLPDFNEVRFANDNDTIGLTDSGRDPMWRGNSIRLQAYDNLTLAGSTYYLDSIIMGGGSTITFTGPTTIYMTGDLKMGGTGLINVSQDPADLQIISSGSLVDLRGSASLYGSVLAPYAEVGLGGTADYYGGVVGQTVKIHGDFAFHVDESLPIYGLIDPPPPVIVK
jgi:hypothetical protein